MKTEMVNVEKTPGRIAVAKNGMMLHVHWLVGMPGDYGLAGIRRDLPKATRREIWPVGNLPKATRREIWPVGNLTEIRCVVTSAIPHGDAKCNDPACGCQEG
jgi:hypothetical protein